MTDRRSRGTTNGASRSAVNWTPLSSTSICRASRMAAGARAEGETPEQLAALKHHFPQPRDAVAYILDQFPIVRQKDEQAHGSYRTKERILEIYDAMLAAQHSGRLIRRS